MSCSITRVFDRMVGLFGNLEILDIFHKGFQKYNSNPCIVYSFLVEGYCRIGMIDRSVETVSWMSKRGISISLYAASTLLSSLIDSAHVDMILKIYDELCKGLLRSEKNSMCDCVVNGLFRKGEVDKGLSFHQEMIDRGFVLDIVVCNKILNSLCIDNRIGVAYDFFNVLLLVGPKPNLVTFSTLINAYSKEVKLDEAFELFNLMLEKCITPDLVIYSILIYGILKAGKVVDGQALIHGQPL